MPKIPTALHQIVWMRYITIHHTTPEIKGCLSIPWSVINRMICGLIWYMKSTIVHRKLVWNTIWKILTWTIKYIKNCCRIRYENKPDDMTLGFELLQRMTNYCGYQLCWSWMFWKGAVKKCVAMGNYTAFCFSSGIILKKRYGFGAK